jgi:hypothetical protein
VRHIEEAVLQMQVQLWWGAAAALSVAVVAGVADIRRNRRADPDAVGFMPWALIQVVAFLVAVILAGLAATGH